MGGVIELFFIMIIVAALVFAPLGYFVYQFNKVSDEPFGDIEPHGDSPSAVNDFAEKIIKFVQEKLAKKQEIVKEEPVKQEPVNEVKPVKKGKSVKKEKLAKK